MIRTVRWAAVAAVGGALVLAGCSQPSYQSPPVPPGPMVQAIRAARAADQSVVQVMPLRDPAVSGDLDAAHAAEASGRYQAALDKVNAALQLSPDAPDILQYRAELEIYLRQFPAAMADARQSYALGSKVGGLCASNWQTVFEIAQADKDQAGMAAAQKARADCHEAGPIRM